MGRSTLIIQALTTSHREPQVQITAVCEKGIVALPGTVYMGVVSPSPTAPVSQIVTLLRREGPFRIQKVESDNPNLAVEITEPRAQGAPATRAQTAPPAAGAREAGASQYRLTVTYKGGWT